MSRLNDMLAGVTRRRADHPALAWEDHHLTYRELDRRADRLAVQMSKTVSPGQRVGILAPNSPALVVGLFAVWRLEAVAIPLNARFRQHELRAILADAEPIELLCVEGHGRCSFVDLMSTLHHRLPTLRGCRFMDPLGEPCDEMRGVAGRLPEPSDDGISVIHYTSGTTGQPKGVLVDEVMPRDCARALNEVLQAAPWDVATVVSPVSHAFGFLTVMAALAAGSLAVLVESTFSPAALLKAIRRHRATMLHGSPTLFATLLRSTVDDLPTLRTGLVAGTICPSHLLERLDRAGLKILNSFGMTEIGAATSCHTDDPPEVRYGTVGRPLPGYRFRIGGSPKDGSQQGEVQVQSRYVTPGYYRQPEQTAAAFVDGWFHTGDIGSLDEQGNLRILGRTTDVVHVAGLKVFPAEVEACLLTHPDVVDAVVVGVPHETMGEVPGAFVIPHPRSDLTIPRLLRFARASMAGYKLPYAVRLVADFPRLGTGKPDRGALAQLLQEEHYAGFDAR